MKGYHSGKKSLRRKLVSAGKPHDLVWFCLCGYSTSYGNKMGEQTMCIISLTIVCLNDVEMKLACTSHRLNSVIMARSNKYVNQISKYATDITAF